MLFLGLSVAIFIVVLAAIWCLCMFMPHFAAHEDEPHYFSTDVTFKEDAEDFVVDNTIMCDAHHLHPCTLDQKIFGCKQLNVQCQHFAEDTVYYENRVPVTIPKNTSPNDGYALAVPIYNTSCNVHHGDPVLIALNAHNDEYMLLCECKNPGLVGKESMLGNCSTPFVCNGKVKDIHVALDAMECVCDKTETSEQLKIGEDLSIPVCRVLRVKEANEKYSDWTDLVSFKNDQLLPREEFSATIRNNLHTKYLLNPCTNALLSDDIIPNAVYDEASKTCQSHDYGIPVRTHILSADNSTETFRPIDGFVASEHYDYIRYTDNVDGRRFLGTLVVEPKIQIHKTQEAQQLMCVRLPEPISLTTQVKQRAAPKLYVPRCEARYFNYSYVCEIQNGYSFSTLDIPRSVYEPPPSLYLWRTEDWQHTEGIESKGVIVNADGVSIDYAHFDAYKQQRAYGMIYANYHSTQYVGNGVAWLYSTEDGNRHRGSITSKK